jgi:hypothetical protein
MRISGSDINSRWSDIQRLCKEPVRASFLTGPAFDTRRMRTIGLLALVVLIALALGVGDARAGAPTLRVVPGPSLAVAGTGFVPRTVVVLRLNGPAVERVVRVTSGRRGGFLVRFALEKCSLTTITASGIRSRSARIPLPWFVRECPPPPPLAPAASVG